jgi:hypothetical protein
VIAYKFLERGRIGPFSGFRWPERDWVETSGQLELCRHGVHACAEDALSEWLSDELWVLELDGAIERHDGLLVGERARLVRHVEGWDDAAAGAFALACVERLHDRARSDERFRSFASDVQRHLDGTRRRRAAVIAYIARHAAQLVDPRGWEDERVWQSASIRTLAGLA